MDVGLYIQTVCKDLDDSVSQCEIETAVQHGIHIETDRAISSALIVNELITNAAKYAYQGRSGGKIQVTIAGAGDAAFSISVRDRGVGLPEGYDPGKAKGLGMRIVNSFVRQLHGSVAVLAHDPGAEFVVTIPRRLPR
jgi:two-component sensor histidine kinase